MPTSEELLIMVNAQIVTNLVPPKSIEIKNERSNRVSMTVFTIQNGASLSLTRWQPVTIYSSDMATVHFNGFITDIATVSRGISVDYDLTCSSVEILLQRSVIDGTFTGTDDTIIADMLANAYPDLSDYFDWTSGITPLSTSDLSIDFQDMNLLDALNNLNALAGGDGFSQDYSDATRINMARIPGISSIPLALLYYEGRHVVGGNWATTYPGWTGTTTFGASLGESGGGIRQTAQIVSGYRVFLHFSDSDALGDPYSPKIHISKNDSSWLAVGFRGKVVGAAGTYTVTFSAVTYDEGGTIYHDGTNINLTDSTSTVGSWVTFNRSIDLSDTTTIPDNGWVVIKMMVHHASNSFDFYYDSFVVEVLSGVAEQTAGVYFNGEAADANWLGARYDSASALGANPLTWGSNPDAPFDVDIDTGTEIFDDFSIDYNSLDSIASVFVVGYTYEDADWIYPNNGNAVSYHFDLETIIYPAEGNIFPLIYYNIGSDGTPNWSSLTPATRQDGFAAGNVLYDMENHWLEFQDAPPDLELSFRVVGRIKQRIRTVVSNEELKDEEAIELTGVINIENITSPAEAYDLGQAELARRAPGPTAKFYTYEPGLSANDEIDIDDTLQSFSETLIIERVTRRYLGGGKGRFYVECGKLSEGLDDIIYSTNQSANDQVPVAEDVQSVEVALLVDQDGAVLLDQDSNQLLDIV